MVNITVKQAANGVTKGDRELSFDQHAVTVKEIIEAAVRKKILQLTDQAGYHRYPKHQPDIEKQIYMALTAFQRHEYFVIVNQCHVTLLHDVVYLKNSSEIRFLRVSPLVGG